MYLISRSARNFLRRGLVAGEAPDDVCAHDVLEADATVRARPGSAARLILLARSGLTCSAVRVIEIAFIAIDSRPATIAWLFDDAVQAKISFDIPCRYSSRPNFSTSTVSLLFRTTRCSSFWMNDPKHIIIAIRAMFESISFDMPMPIGLPIARSLGAARSTFSHVVGRDADLAPEVGPPVDRVGHVVVREREVLLRPRVVGRLLRERLHLPALLVDLLDDLVVVDHLVLVLRGRRRGRRRCRARSGRRPRRRLVPGCRPG